MLSYWEKESFIHYDHIIIGSGIVGVSTAISILEQRPKSKVLIVERGALPTGASTKNAGFACFGSLTELCHDIQNMGEDLTFELVKQRWSGLLKLRTRLGDENIDFYNHGGYELINYDNLDVIDKISEVNKLLWDIFKKPVFNVKNSKISEFGFDSNYVKSIIYNPFEGQIHTGLMMKNLIQKAQKLGANFICGTEVTNINHTANFIKLNTKNYDTKSITFTCDNVGICTNAFTNKLIKKIDIKPGRGIVLITKPIKKLPFKGIFHYEQGYYYFRNEGNRIIFGGGRNLDFEKESTTKFEMNDMILSHLKKQLKEIILPKHAFEIDYAWSGIMAFGKSRIPTVEKISDNTFAAIRLGGMGIAIGTMLGEKLSKLML